MPIGNTTPAPAHNPANAQWRALAFARSFVGMLMLTSVFIPLIYSINPAIVWRALGANPDAELINAALNGDVEQINLALSHGASINAHDDFGTTALMYVAAIPDQSIVRFIVDHGADINAADHSGRTALMFAAAKGNQPIMTLLLAKGANADHRDNQGHTAADLTAENESPPVRLRLACNSSPLED